MRNVRVHILLLMFAAVIALAAGETLLSRGMKQVGKASPRWTAQVLAVVGNKWVWAGVGLLVVHVGLYMLAMRDADLSFVLPLTAASYPIAAILAKYVLDEEIGRTRWIGTFLITLGVAVIGFGDAASKR